MTKQVCWAALCALSLTLTLSSCSKVENCKQGEAGCIGGSCENTACSFDLECVPELSVCGARSGDTFDVGGCKVGERGCAGGACVQGKCNQGFQCVAEQCMPKANSGGDAGTPDGGEPKCSCPDGVSICFADPNDPDDCTVNYCEAPEVLPNSLPKPEAISCFKANEEAPDLTFNELCLRHCKLECQRREWFCSDFECPEDACKDGSAEMLAACAIECPVDPEGSQTQTECMQNACVEMRGSECPDVQCPGSNKRIECEAEGVRCTNDPSKCGYLFDGWCDDGDTYNTSRAPGSNDSAECPWGTDCADCGPRYGDDAPVNLPLGAPCGFNVACAGHKQNRVNGEWVVDLETNASWCVDYEEPVDGNYRCLLDCSAPGETCPLGTECQRQPIGTEGLEAGFCVPVLCGE